MFHSDAVGLVLARPARTLGVEPFFAELIAGLEERLSVEGRSLLFHVVADHDAEMAAYRRWSEGEMVEAVVVVNLSQDDPRPPLLVELGLPAVAIGGPSYGLPISNVWVDDTVSINDAVTYLADLGHTHLARVSGPLGLHHTRARDDAFHASCVKLGVRATVVVGDYSEESGRDATNALLGMPQRPTAVIYDSDIMGLAGLSAAIVHGLSMPDDLSILAWDDSALCRLSTLPLSTMSLDVHAMGFQAAEAIISTLAGGPVKTHPVRRPPRLTVRQSTVEFVATQAS